MFDESECLRVTFENWCSFSGYLHHGKQIYGVIYGTFIFDVNAEVVQMIRDGEITAKDAVISIYTQMYKALNVCSTKSARN